LANGGRLFVRCFDGAADVRENIAGGVLASGTTMQWNRAPQKQPGATAEPPPRRNRSLYSACTPASRRMRV
jgi:hypothetical protein